MRLVFVDSSAVLALLDREDADHPAAVDGISRLESERASVFMTNFVRAEAYTLVGVRLSWAIARKWLHQLDIPLESVTARDEQRAIEILLQYDDKDFSFVDATSFAVMERLRVYDAFTFDKHFAQYGFNVL